MGKTFTLTVFLKEQIWQTSTLLEHSTSGHAMIQNRKTSFPHQVFPTKLYKPLPSRSLTACP